MKTKFLIAVDTSGIYDHSERKKDVLTVLRDACNNVEVDLVTFDANGIVPRDIQEFLNSDLFFFMETPSYKELFPLMEEYDAQQLFTNASSVDVLISEIEEYAGAFFE